MTSHRNGIAVYYRLLKFLDLYAGRALCRLCSLFRSRGEVPPLPPRPTVVVIKFWGMGTILLSTPALRNIREELQPARLVMLTLEQNRAFCESLGIFTEVIGCRLSPLPAFLFQILRAVLRLRRMKADVVLDLEFFTCFTALITFLVGAKVNEGFYSGTLYRGNFYQLHIPFNQYWHITDIYLNAAAKLVPHPKPWPLAAPAADDRALKALGLGRKGYIVVNPNSDPIGLQRRWPQTHFIELIDRIHAAWDIPVLLLGNAREAVYNDGLINGLRRPSSAVNLGGKTSIGELAAIIRDAACLITNDSGPLHLACALGTPTVSFFGPETPVIFGPRGEGHIVFFRNLDCSPCMNVHRAKEIDCVRGRADCLAEIRADEVWERIEPLLAAAFGERKKER